MDSLLAFCLASVARGLNALIAVIGVWFDVLRHARAAGGNFSAKNWRTDLWAAASGGSIFAKVNGKAPGEGGDWRGWARVVIQGQTREERPCLI